MTTPVNNGKFRRLIESEDMRNLNTNLNTQQSFSSFLTNPNCVTSNGSSFLTVEDKKLKIGGLSNNNNNNVINTTNTNNQHNINTNKANNNLISNDNSHTNNSNVYDLHANSVDLTSQSPFKMNYKTTNNNPNRFTNNTNFPNYNQFITGIDYDNISPFNSTNYNTIRNSQNFLTPKNISINNLNPNLYSAYSFCLDNMYYKNYGDINNVHMINKTINTINPPIKFNPNDDKAVLDNLLILTKDQNGCRMIQKKFEEKKEEFMAKFYEKIKNNLIDILCDQFGNYVIQKFVECLADKSYISKIIEKIKPKLYYISTHSYGTRAFQKLLDYISNEQDYEVIKEFLIGNIYPLIKDTIGNHVMQKIILTFPVNKNSFIMKEITENILEISKLKQGGCIFQKILEKASNEDKVS